MDVGNLISGFSTFSKTSLNTWKFSVHILLKPGLESFEHYFASVWDECNCAVVWAFFGIAFLWDWNENWPFPVLWPLLSFPNLLDVNDREWDGWIASPTWWMWVWVNSKSWWWTGRPGVLQFMGSQMTEELNWTEPLFYQRIVTFPQDLCFFFFNIYLFGCSGP